MCTLTRLGTDSNIACVGRLELRCCLVNSQEININFGFNVIPLVLDLEVVLHSDACELIGYGKVAIIIRILPDDACILRANGGLVDKLLGWRIAWVPAEWNFANSAGTTRGNNADLGLLCRDPQVEVLSKSTTLKVNVVQCRWHS
jgi:hypothetical protein